MFKNGSTSLKIAFPLPINIHFYRLLVDLWWKSLFDCVHSIITKVESQYFDTITDIQAYCVRQALPVKIKSLTNKLNTAIFNELSFHNKLYLSESTLFTSSRDYGLISNLDLWSLHLDSVMYFIRGALFRAIQQICSPSIRISMTHELPSFSFSFSLSLSLSSSLKISLSTVCNRWICSEFFWHCWNVFHFNSSTSIESFGFFWDYWRWTNSNNVE